MSETESGSDLAAVRTRAVRDGEDYRLTGSKIWTSHAHRSTHAYVLARTGSEGGKHEGLTEFLVDLSSPGVEIRPIYDLGDEHHFNEMVFDTSSYRPPGSSGSPATAGSRSPSSSPSSAAAWNGC